MDRNIVSQEVHSLSTDSPYDLHVQGDTVFTKGELSLLTESLLNDINTNKVVTFIDFGREHRIDPLLLKKLVQKANLKTSNDPNIIILGDLIVSEADLTEAKKQFFDFLNNSESPVKLSEVTFENVLFQNPDIKATIQKALSKAIKEGEVSGSIEKNEFVPQVYILNLQKLQVTSLESNGVVELAKLREVGVKDANEFLKDKLTAKFTVLEDYIILDSYVEGIVAEIEAATDKDAFVDFSNVSMLGVSSESADRSTITSMALPKFLESTSTPVQSVYFQELNKKAKKTALPNFVVTKTLEEEIESILVNALAIPAAKSASEQVKGSDKLAEFEDGDNALSSEVFKVLPRFDEKRISSFLSKEFSRNDKSAKAVPSPLLRYYGQELGKKLKEIYDSTLVGEVRTLYNAAKIDNLVLLLINLRGVLDVATLSGSLAKKLYGLLTENIAEQSSYPYISKDLASSEMEELEVRLVSELEAIQPAGFDLDTALSKRQQRIIDGLERALARVKSVDEAVSVLHLGTIIVHSKVLAHENQYGSLNISGKQAVKVLKTLEKKVDVNELRALLTATKEKNVTEELLNSAKSLALDM